MNQVRLECVSSESGTQPEQVHARAEITAAKAKITAPRSRGVPAGTRAPRSRDTTHLQNDPEKTWATVLDILETKQDRMAVWKLSPAQ